MAEITSIAWTDHTFNPWIGCTNVSDGCLNCYAEILAKRFGLVQWGDHPRYRTVLESCAERTVAGKAAQLERAENSLGLGLGIGGQDTMTATTPKIVQIANAWAPADDDAGLDAVDLVFALDNAGRVWKANMHGGDPWYQIETFPTPGHIIQIAVASAPREGHVALERLFGLCHDGSLWLKTMTVFGERAWCQRRWKTRPHAGARVGQFGAVFSTVGSG